jgi:hypothetical protein
MRDGDDLLRPDLYALDAETIRRQRMTATILSHIN